MPESKPQLYLSDISYIKRMAAPPSIPIQSFYQNLHLSAITQTFFLQIIRLIPPKSKPVALKMP
jgi:hypothetical protein